MVGVKIDDINRPFLERGIFVSITAAVKASTTLKTPAQQHFLTFYLKFHKTLAMAEKIWSNIEHDVQDQQSLTSLLNDGRIPADSDAAFLKSEVDRVREKSGSAEDAVRNIKNEARMRESLESRENGGRVRKGGEASKMQVSR